MCACLCVHVHVYVAQKAPGIEVGLTQVKMAIIRKSDSLWAGELPQWLRALTTIADISIKNIKEIW